jgi:hypothetical protein
VDRPFAVAMLVLALLALVVPIVLSRRGNRPRGFAEED